MNAKLKYNIEKMFDHMNVTGDVIYNIYYTPAADFEDVSVEENIQIYAHNHDVDVERQSLLFTVASDLFESLKEIMLHFGRHDKLDIPIITELRIRKDIDGNCKYYKIVEDGKSGEELILVDSSEFAEVMNLFTELDLVIAGETNILLSKPSNDTIEVHVYINNVEIDIDCNILNILSDDGNWLNSVYSKYKGKTGILLNPEKSDNISVSTDEYDVLRVSMS